ncbi:hypothetical protein L596_002423 [Steinernema carpocapsae]|uniref:Uncharacterized protein n=1 Tax=Steinernema carpocapsae TaxID=34508 RepID=A0A4U8UPJ9_STECR|nr:hypothetical protein L596_002423 [Steinernema carpocapsae]
MQRQTPRKGWEGRGTPLLQAGRRRCRSDVTKGALLIYICPNHVLLTGTASSTSACVNAPAARVSGTRCETGQRGAAADCCQIVSVSQARVCVQRNDDN